MERPLVPVTLVLLLTVASVPLPPATGLHSGDDIHGPRGDIRSGVAFDLWFRCTAVSGGTGETTDVCGSGGNDKTLRTSGQGGEVKDQAEEPDDDGTGTKTVYEFRSSRERLDFEWTKPSPTAPDYVLDEAEVDLFLDWRGEWNITVTLIAHDQETGENESLASTFEHIGTDDPINEDTVGFTIAPQGGVLLEPGHNLLIKVDGEVITEAPQGATDWNLWPNRDTNGPADGGVQRSTVELSGELASVSGWTHDESGVPRRGFSKSVPADQRKIFATYVVHSAFGADVLDLDEGIFRSRKPGQTVFQTDLVLNEGRSANSRVVLQLDEPWSYGEDIEARIYNLTYTVDTNSGGDLAQAGQVTIGIAIDLDLRGASEREVKVGENATFTVTVTNGAVGDLDIALGAPSPAPGWDVIVDPIRMVLKQGESRDVEVRVRPPAAAQEGDAENVTLQAEALGRPDLDPATREMRTVITTDTIFDPQVLVRGASNKTVAPGTEGTFDLEVVNQGTVRDTILLSRGPIRDGWSVSFSESRLTLDPGEREEVAFDVKTAPGESEGSFFDVDVEAQSSGDPSVVESRAVTVTIGLRIEFDVRVHEPVHQINPQIDHTVFRVSVHHRSNVVDGYQPINVRLQPGRIGEGMLLYSDLDCTPEKYGQRILEDDVDIIPAKDPSKLQTITVAVECVDMSATDNRTNTVDVEPRPKPASGQVFPLDTRRANPGDSFNFPVRLSNTGAVPHSQAHNATTNYTVSIPVSPDGWKVGLGTDVVPSERFEIWSRSCSEAECTSPPAPFDTTVLNVTVPEDAEAGRYEFVVAARSIEKPQASDQHTYVVEVAPHREVDLSAPAASIDVEAGRPALFNVVVDNLGNVREEVDVRFNRSGLPSSWRLEHATLSRSLPPGGARYLPVEVVPPAGATPGTSGEVEVRIETGFGTSSTLTLNATVQRRAAINITADPATGSAEPGTELPVDVTVTNGLGSRETIDLDATPLPAGFDVEILRDGEPVSSVALDAGASADLEVRIGIAEDALADAEVGTLLTASVDDGDRISSKVIRATVEETFDVRLSVDEAAKVTRAGVGTDYFVTIENGGTGRDTFSLFLSPQTASPGWTTLLDRKQVKLPAKASETFLLQVFPSASVAPGTTETTTVIAESQSRPGVRSFLQLNTTTLLRRVGFASGNGSIAFVPGETVRAGTALVNEGNAEDRFRLEVADVPAGWSVDDSDAVVTLGPGGQGVPPLTITAPDDADQGPTGMDLIARSQFDRSVSAEATVVLRVVDFTGRDLDDDGFDEVAADRNRDDVDGFEDFVEVETDQGFASELVTSRSFGPTVKSGFIVKVREAPNDRYVFWDPGRDVVTDVVRASVLSPNAENYFVDVDDDGITDRLYDADDDRLLPAVSLIGQDGFLVDTDRDGDMDTHYSAAVGLKTTAAPFIGQEAAVDTDGDGSFDLVADEETGQNRPYTVMDSATKAAVDHTLVVLLLAVALVLLPVVVYVRRGSSGEDRR